MSGLGEWPLKPRATSCYIFFFFFWIEAYQFVEIGRPARNEGFEGIFFFQEQNLKFWWETREDYS